MNEFHIDTRSQFIMLVIEPRLPTSSNAFPIVLIPLKMVLNTGHKDIVKRKRSLPPTSSIVVIERALGDLSILQLTAHKYVVKRKSSLPSTSFVILIRRAIGTQRVMHTFGRIISRAVAYYIHKPLGDLSILQLTVHKFVVERKTSLPSTSFVVLIRCLIGSQRVMHTFGRIISTAVAYYIHTPLGDLSIQECTDYKSTFQALLTIVNRGSTPSSVLVGIGDASNDNPGCRHFISDRNTGARPRVRDCSCEFENFSSIRNVE